MSVETNLTDGQFDDILDQIADLIQTGKPFDLNHFTDRYPQRRTRFAISTRDPRASPQTSTPSKPQAKIKIVAPNGLLPLPSSLSLSPRLRSPSSEPGRIFWRVAAEIVGAVI